MIRGKCIYLCRSIFTDVWEQNEYYLNEQNIKKYSLRQQI
jgi:hypothetical protein